MTPERRLELYHEHGVKCRRSYIAALADDYGVARVIAFAIADALGPEEDFDGLVTELQDLEGQGI